MNYQLTVNEEQLRTVQAALDLYSRLGMGQLEEIVNHFRWLGDPRLKDRHEQLDVAKMFMDAVKVLLFPRLGSGAHFGIYGQEVPDNYRVAWDLIKVIRHQLWLDDPNRSDVTVDASPATQNSDQPLARITRDSAP